VAACRGITRLRSRKSCHGYWIDLYHSTTKNATRSIGPECPLLTFVWPPRLESQARRSATKQEHRGTAIDPVLSV
jgi:hypothetical protein